MSRSLRHVLVALLVAGFVGTVGCQKRTEPQEATEADTTMVSPPPAPPASNMGADTTMMGTDSMAGHDSM
jgi:hypothetical protein